MNINSAAPMAVRLFGRMEVQLNGKPLPRTRTRKEQWLLALLILEHSTSVSRVWLAQTLWPSPDFSADLANLYLRRSLSELRKALGDQAGRLLSPSARTISLDVSNADIDIVSFDVGIAKRDPTTVTDALTLYRGAVLSECTEAWAAPIRERYHQTYEKALEELAARAMAMGDFEGAERYLRQAIAVDPFSETMRRYLMEALWRAGDLNGALREYHDLSDRLHKSEHAVPSDETTKLFQQIAHVAREAARVQPVVSSPSAQIAETRSAGYLPLSATDLIGRENDVVEIKSVLSTSRLVTLAGTGGVGKTSLSLRVAHDVKGHYPDGAWFIDLATLTNEELLPQAVANVFKLRDDGDLSIDVALTEFLRPKSVLMVLDNCEHLIEACALLIGRILAHCPNVRVLATSRQLLDLSGERVWRVPSLPVPDVSDVPLDSLAALRLIGSSPAVRLFVERASAVDNQFQISSENARIIAHLCRRLDGIPLAIELAAARTKVLSLEEIASRLDDQFRLLTGGSRGLLPRQQTLRALIDWSYALLIPCEQSLLARLSVFRNGCTLEAAEFVCADPLMCPLDILDMISALIDKSLVFAERDSDGQSRYRLLESVRQYAAERLSATGEREDRQKLHLEWFLNLSQRAELRLRSGEQNLWLNRLEADYDNLRLAIIESKSDPTRTETSLKLAHSLWYYWLIRGHFTEGREHLGDLLRLRDQPWTMTDAKAGVALALLTGYQGEYSVARGLAEKSYAYVRDTGDPSLMAFSLMVVGWTNISGNLDAAAAPLQESLALARCVGDDWLLAQALSTLGYYELECERPNLAEAHFEEGLMLARRVGDGSLIVEFVYHLGRLANARRDLVRAQPFLEECLTAYTSLNDRYGLIATLHDLGFMALKQRHHAEALRMFGDALRIGTDLSQHNKPQIIALVEGVACVLASVKDEMIAVSLFSAARTLYGDAHAPVLAVWRDDCDYWLQTVRETISLEKFQSSWERGRLWNLERAIETALAQCELQAEKLSVLLPSFGLS